MPKGISSDKNAYHFLGKWDRLYWRESEPLAEYRARPAMTTAQAFVSELRKSTGILLIGHGTRDPRGASELFETSELFVKSFPHICAEPCFLEIAEPNISAGIDRLMAQGVERLVAVPMLLFSAGHAKQDIPAALEAAKKSYPSLEIRQAKHLGCHSAILRLSEQRYSSQAKGVRFESTGQELLLMVGRGSRDNGARDEMQRFCELRRARTPVAEMKVAYLAMAEPLLDKALEEIEESEFRHIVVQPHLLFHGALLEKLSKRVEHFAARNRQKTWRTVPHLGPDALLVEAIADRIYETKHSRRRS